MTNSPSSALEPPQPARRPERIVVFGGPRDGAGRTSLVAALSVALSLDSRRVGVLDLDLRTRSLSVWLARRRAALQGGLDLVLPAAPIVPLRPPASVEAAEREEAARWPSLIASMAGACDVLLIDAPSGGGVLVRLAHEVADVAVTLVTESGAGFDALFEPEDDGLVSARPASYVRCLWEARRRRTSRGEPVFDWLLMRGRSAGESEPETSAFWRGRCERVERLIGARRGPYVGEHAGLRHGGDEGLTVFDEMCRGAFDRERVAADLRDLAIVARLAGLEGARLAF